MLPSRLAKGLAGSCLFGVGLNTSSRFCKMPGEALLDSFPTMLQGLHLISNVNSVTCSAHLMQYEKNKINN